MNLNKRENGILISLGLFWALGLCGCLGTSGETDNNVTKNVEAHEIAFAKAFADRDIDAFLNFISPEAVFFMGNEPLRGHEAITQAWSPFFEGETAPFSWLPEVVEVLESGRLALSTGPVYSESGERLGNFNTIWRKDNDGEWRVVFDKGS